MKETIVALTPDELALELLRRAGHLQILTAQQADKAFAKLDRVIQHRKLNPTTRLNAHYGTWREVA